MRRFQPPKTGPVPNLFIIGAAKSGTTSLHNYLGLHPDVFMCDPKEPRFFVPEVEIFPKDLDWYLGLFEKAGDAKVIGEASTDYTKRPTLDGVAQRISTFSPGARMIYLMRDPIERAISHYWHLVKQAAEHKPILAALHEKPSYKWLGDYAYQLGPYLEVFGEDRVMALTFESLVQDPAGVVNRILEWLELPAIAEEFEFEARNVAPPTVNKPRGKGYLNRFRSSQAWDRIAHLFPPGIKRMGSQLAIQPTNPKKESKEEAVELLLPWARGRVLELQELLQRDFPEWKTTCGPGSTGEAP